MNLIVTCGRSLESEAKNEIKKIITELGDQEPEILNSGMRGILTVSTVVKPSEVIDYARNKINEEEPMKRREIGQAKAREVLLGPRRMVQGPLSCWFTDSINTAGWLMGWRSARHARASTGKALTMETLMLQGERSARSE